MGLSAYRAVKPITGTSTIETPMMTETSATKSMGSTCMVIPFGRKTFAVLRA